ncbi:LacI family DNA-binding transcriptional regulator [Alteromonas macleodii]|uniref:LacI family DNA-binding transcriptional regulator n=1 Tax=Alteromonas macleodii TaxID=28108 RepID=UPI00066B3746|nr:LacI family DNA-binding transcriptional regulator [Alteromonas macleodii]MAC09694.1 LacI family transcriptional regulator [Alteromonas sp.]MEC7483142.1 LacI family DNA-binding transcriptional regulator [Pseudomonadota bacterium]NKX21995.1 LacI family DNA-binding transcriptional regulator [Alteromonadaceae bacterium A_SAG2]MEC8488150.1 LacI family DNA-binding transcriptional regulator [Pseudomonadota bacterium]MEC8787024.1 LacI family DNA-binding transcriptional regulator [Pseudomonadota bac
MPTIYQVAERAGVSLSTVSRVLNGKASVNKVLKERVEKAVKELNYRPNSVARSLANNRTDSVGVLVPELNAPFFGDLMQAVESTLRAADKHVIISVGRNCLETEKDAVEFLISRNCDALIMHAEALSDEYLLELNQSKLPVALVNRQVEGLPEACTSLDNEKGGYLATRHLLELGHKDIAYISGPTDKCDASLRLEGHKRALSEAGLPTNPQLIFNGDYSEEDGKIGLLELMARDVPFTALVCANDWMASGAISCARDLGMSLPHDLSVVGFDDVVFAHHVFPRLTTVSNPIAEMAEMSAKYILNKVYGQANNVQLYFEPSLVVRESTVKHEG